MNAFPNWLHFLETFPRRETAPDLRSDPIFDASFEAFTTPDDARRACAEIPMSFSLVPLGKRGDEILVTDLSVASAEAEILAPLVLCSSGYCTPTDSELGELYREKVSFAEKAEQIERTRKKGELDKVVSFHADLMRRPIYTATGTDQLMQVFTEILELQDTRGAETLSHRLAVAGDDGEKWRIIGAERAIAGRIRDAVVALSGAAFLGARTEFLGLPASQCLGNAGWKWASTALKFHKKRWKAS